MRLLSLVFLALVLSGCGGGSSLGGGSLNAVYLPDINGKTTQESIDELKSMTKVAREKLTGQAPNQTFSYGQEFFVATNGDDSNSGTLDSPWRSLEGARDGVRAYTKKNGLPNGGIVVWFRAGIYNIVKSSYLTDDFQKDRSYGIDFKAEDSGAEGKPISYSAYKDEKVRIMGAVPIKSEWFKSVDDSDSLWDRLDTNAREHIKVANLGEHGIKNIGKIGENHYALNTPLELFDDTTALNIARWPDKGQSNVTPPKYTDSKIHIYGDGLSPDVSGGYTRETNVKSTDNYYVSFKKDTLVDGKQYYLRHFKAQSDGVRRTWGIAEAGASKYPFEYSGTGYSIPRDFQTRDYPIDTSGTPTTIRFEDIQFGLASYRKALSDTSFEYIGDRPSRWKNTGDLWVNGGFQYIWRNYHIPITNIDTGTKTITLGEKPGLGMKSIGKDMKRPYYVYNVLEELTTAGEYFIDKDSTKLYYYPKRDLSVSKLYGSMIQYYMINFDGASYVEFHNMSLEMSRQDLVDFDSGSHNLLSHMNLRLNGRYAVKIGENTSYSGVEYSTISNSGEGAITLNGGDYKTLTDGHNFARNNDIIGDNRWGWGSAVSIYGVGNSFEHNDIHGYNQHAISYTSNNCSVSYNNIHDVLRYDEDAGAIYSGRSWHHRGNKINYNFIHDIQNNYSQQILTGIYMDATLSEQEIKGNIFYNIDGKGILQSGGRDNTIENNLFVRVATPFMGMNHGIEQYSTQSGNSFNMLERALKYNFKHGIWASTYPKLAQFPTDWNDIIDTHWLLPEHNSFRYNAGEDNLRWALNGKIRYGTKDLEVYDHAEMTATDIKSKNFAPIEISKIGIQY